MNSLEKIEVKKIIGMEDSLNDICLKHSTSLSRVFTNNNQIFIPTVLKVDDDNYLILNMINEFIAFKKCGNVDIRCLVLHDLKGISKESASILFQNILNKPNSIKIAKKISALELSNNSIANELGIPLVTVEFFKDLLTFDWTSVTKAEKIKVDLSNQMDMFEF